MVTSKKDIARNVGRTFRWVRKNILTDQVLKQELGIDPSQFKKWKTIPPRETRKIQQYLKKLVTE